MCCDLVSCATSSVGRFVRLVTVDRRLPFVELRAQSLRVSRHAHLEDQEGEREGNARLATEFGEGLRVDALGDELEALELADARDDVAPAALEVVAVDHGDVEERLDALDVLGPHLAKVVEERELGEGRDERVALEVEVEQAHDLDRLLEPFEGEADELEVVRVLERARDAGEDGHPRHLEHGLDVLGVRRRVVLVARATAAPLPSDERAEEGLQEERERRREGGRARVSSTGSPQRRRRRRR